MVLRLVIPLLVIALAAGAARAGEEPHRRLVIGGDCVACDFQGANLAGAHFLGGDFTGGNFSRAQLLGAHLSDLTLNEADFEGASLTDARLANVSFNGANLSDAGLQRARLHRVRFAGADLQRADLSGAVFLLSDFTGADLSDTDGSDAVFRQADFSSARLREARFGQAHVFGARMIGSDLRSARLEDAIIENSDLTGADLRGARLAGTHFIAVNLTGVDFRGAQGLGQAVFRHACGADIDGLTAGLSLEPCSAQGVRAVMTAVSVDAARLERRRAEMEHARRAIEQALAEVEADTGLPSTVRLQMVESLREGWAAAAEALARSEAGLETSGPGQWTFEIRREEIGEPLRIILEQMDEVSSQLSVRTASGAAPQPPQPPARPQTAKPGPPPESGDEADADAPRR